VKVLSKGAEAMSISKPRLDRRILKTRQSLQRAFMDLVQEQGFDAISIHDITERANVNRSTFYLHFEDKYKLTEAVIRENFQRMLTTTLPADLPWNRATLHRLIVTMLEWFEGKYQHQRHPPPILAVVAPLLEQVLQEELTLFLRAMLGRHAQDESCSALDVQAGVLSWAIFGPTLEWGREPVAVPMPQMADLIFQAIIASAPLT
jgi:AcrR family transcriptional regulator